MNFCTANIFLLWQCLEALLGIQTWHCNNQVTVSQTAVLFLAHMYSWFPTTLLQSVNLQTEGTAWQMGYGHQETKMISRDANQTTEVFVSTSMFVLFNLT